MTRRPQLFSLTWACVNGVSRRGGFFGLDSIDMLELSLSISKQYGFQLRSDDKDVVAIFASLASLTKAIDSRRTK